MFRLFKNKIKKSLTLKIVDGNFPDKLWKKYKKYILNLIAETLFISGINPADMKYETVDKDVMDAYIKYRENHDLNSASTIKQRENKKTIFSKLKKKFDILFKKSENKKLTNEKTVKINNVDKMFIKDTINLNIGDTYKSYCDKNIIESYMVEDFIKENEKEWNEFYKKNAMYIDDNEEMKETYKIRFFIETLNNRINEILKFIMPEIYISKPNIKELLNIVYKNIGSKYVTVKISNIDYRDEFVIIEISFALAYQGKVYEYAPKEWADNIKKLTICVDRKLDENILDGSKY